MKENVDLLIPRSVNKLPKKKSKKKKKDSNVEADNVSVIDQPAFASFLAEQYFLTELPSDFLKLRPDQRVEVILEFRKSPLGLLTSANANTVSTNANSISNSSVSPYSKDDQRELFHEMMEGQENRVSRSCFTVTFFISICVVLAGVILHIIDYSMMKITQESLGVTDEEAIANPALVKNVGNLPIGSMMTPMMNGGMTLVVLGVMMTIYSLVRLMTLQNEYFQKLDRNPVPPGFTRTVEFTRAFISNDPKDQSLLGNAEWTFEHTKICVIMTIAIVVDIMKPATIGFLMPGLLWEYGSWNTTTDPLTNVVATTWLPMDAVTGAELPICAIAGTTFGSFVWGGAADILGRRAAILLSVILFCATAICGAMPSFELNLVMCFLMGSSVGGLIPVCISMLGEVLPSKYRTRALIAILSTGSAGGYLAASGCAFEISAWRVLWFIGLPTGSLLLPLLWFMPESYRFLILNGRNTEAIEVMKFYLGKDIPITLDNIHKYIKVVDVPIVTHTAFSGAYFSAKFDGIKKLFGTSQQAIATGALIVLAFAWGLAYYGFVNYSSLLLKTVWGTPVGPCPCPPGIWTPELCPIEDVVLCSYNSVAAKHVLFNAAGWSMLSIPPLVWLYGWWNSRWAVFILTVFEFVLFAIWAAQTENILGTINNLNLYSFKVWYACTLSFVNALLAMIIIYAAETFPTALRASGTGLVAGFTKIAGIIAPFIMATIIEDKSFDQMAVVVMFPLLFGGFLFAWAGFNTIEVDSDRMVMDNPKPATSV